MSLRHAWILALYPAWGAAWAQENPTPGQDYQSLQIASSTELKGLQSLYEQHRNLPFLRLEKRGNQFTLRAGFWRSTEEARRALSGRAIPGAQLRIAVLRPELLLQTNWASNAPLAQDARPQAAEPLLPKPATPAPPSSPSPSPVQPAQPAPVRAPESITPKANRPDDGKATGLTLRNLNLEDMALSYGVLLSTGDLQPALQIARAAVQMAPSNREWRLRLAKVAEWTQQPLIAAQQWAYIFQQGARDAETLANVTRLAWQMEDLQVPLSAWQTLAKRRPLSAAEMVEVLKLFEESAQPAEGSLFFEAQYLQRGDLQLLEYAARLAGNYGNDARTLQLQILRSQANPFSLGAVLDVVMVYVRSNRLPEALAFMQSHEARVPAEASEFWRLLGEVAWDLQRVDIARGAYANYVKSESATSDDWGRLVALAGVQQTDQAANLALEGYRRFGTFALLTQALEMFANQAQWTRMGEALALLQGAALTDAESSSQFLLLRARYAQGLKQADNAWADLRRAMVMEPVSKTVGLSSLWFLIDQQRTAELTVALKHYQSNGGDADYWPAFAAGHQVLNQQRQALSWYQRIVAKAPQDAFTLLNYADALERNQQAGMAARVRRHAWLVLRAQFPADTARTEAEMSSAEWRTLLRLSLLNRPGDPALQQARDWARSLKALPADASAPETTELILAWAISTEQFVNARTWMARRFREQAQAPVWGRAQVALQTGDTRDMDDLLQTQREALPIYNRYDIERAMGLHAEALTTAFNGLTRSPDDEALYDRWRQHAPAQAAYLESTLKSENAGSFSNFSVGQHAQWPVKQGLVATLGWTRARQTSGDAGLQTLLTDTEQLNNLGLQWASPGQNGALTLIQRRELGTMNGAQLSQSLRLPYGLQWSTRLDIGNASQASPAMQIAGAEDSLSTTLGVQLDKRLNLQATPAVKRYYSQLGDDLGRGQSLDLEAGYRLRVDYPDWRLRVNLRRQVFDREDGLSAGSLQRYPEAFQQALSAGTLSTTNYFLPESSTSWGLCLGMGENLGGQSLQNGFSRGWRPFVDACLRHDSQAGEGYSSQVGLAGSVFGRDLMRIELQHSDGLASSNGPGRTLTLRYRNYF